MLKGINYVASDNVAYDRFKNIGVGNYCRGESEMTKKIIEIIEGNNYEQINNNYNYAKNYGDIKNGIKNYYEIME